MKVFKNLLPALGLVFGATLAMAMNVPTIVAEKTATIYWTPDPGQPEGYRDVTQEVENSAYDCNTNEPNTCVVMFENDDLIHKIVEYSEPGEFSEL
jgi:hypothetical protein